MGKTKCLSLLIDPGVGRTVVDLDEREDGEDGEGDTLVGREEQQRQRILERVL